MKYLTIFLLSFALLGCEQPKEYVALDIAPDLTAPMVEPELQGATGADIGAYLDGMKGVISEGNCRFLLIRATLDYQIARLSDDVAEAVLPDCSAGMAKG